MSSRPQKNLSYLLAAVALTAVLTLAFSAASSGARTLSATVVNDAQAYLAIEANPDSPHKGFVTVSGGKTVVNFASASGVVGTGINPDSTYAFDGVLKITNRGTAPANVAVSLSGADASLCALALTATQAQTAGSYAAGGASPASIATAVGGSVYLGVQLTATGKAAGASVDCTITVAATR